MLYISNIDGRNHYYVFRNADEALRAYYKMIHANEPYFHDTLDKFYDELNDFERRVLEEAANLNTLSEPEARDAVITYDDTNGPSALSHWVAMNLNDMMIANPHMYKGKDRLFDMAVEG